MKSITLGLIGLGTVGRGLVKLVRERRVFVQKKFAVDIHIKTICDLRLDASVIKSLGKVKTTQNFQDILDDNEIDVVVELIGGIHPALEIIKGALQNGKHVVTANKAVISSCGKELFQLAQEVNRSIYFETAVLAGVPVIKTLTEGMAGNRYSGLYGIVNGTCNYILTEMETNNISFKAAVMLAQEKGYAESDPTLDVNGMDSAHKLSVLIQLAMGKFVNAKKDVFTEGITDIAPEDLQYASEMGFSIKLLAIAKVIDGAIEARVHPTLIPKQHPLAAVKGVYNAIWLQADPLGDVLLVGQGAGSMAAASGVFSDLINLAIDNKDKNQVWIGDNPTEIDKLVMKLVSAVKTEYYIRLSIIDQPGVLSKITGILGKNKISIASVQQKAMCQGSAVSLIMQTHMAQEQSLQQALASIKKLPEVKSRPVIIRMEQL